MKHKNRVDNLQDEINLLKAKQESEFLHMREQFNAVAFNLKPSNLIGNIFEDIIPGRITKNSIVDNTIGLTTGFLTRKFLFGASASPVKRAIGSMVQFGISNLVYKNSIAIKAVGGFLLQRLFNKKGKPEMEKKVIDITDYSKS